MQRFCKGRGIWRRAVFPVGEKKWLATVDEAQLNLVTQLGAEQARKTVLERIAYIEALGDKLD